jgi:hypothetical protein
MIATLLLLASSVVFLIAVFRFFKLPFSAAAVFFCLLSVPFAVTLDAVTLSYNNVTATFTLLSAACLFMLLNAGSRFRTQFVFALLSGVCAAIVCVAKITSGLALSFSIPVILLMAAEHKWKNIGGFVAGWLGYQLIHGMVYTPFYTQVNNILVAGGVFAQMDAHYGKFAVLNDAYLFTKDQFYLFLQFTAVFFVTKIVSVKWIKMVLMIAAVCYFYYLFTYSEFKLTGFVYVAGAVLCAAFFVVQVFEKNILSFIQQQSKNIVLGLFLFMIPLIVVLGTNNVYYHNYVFAGMPLAVFCTVLLEKSGVYWYKQLLMLWIAGCVVYVCYTKIVLQPYRILPLTQQTEKVDAGMLKGVKLDLATFNRYHLLQRIMVKHGFTKNNGLICMGKMQGLQYMLEASSPGGVMFSPTFKELYLRNLALDTNGYSKPCFVLSDYRFADHLQEDSQNWESRFTQSLSEQYHQSVEWTLLDSVPFETAPLGVLYLYQTPD